MEHLCIDIGNTRTKIALCKDGQVVEIRTDGSIPPFTGPVRSAIVKTGKDVHQIRQKLDKKGVPVLEINAGIRLPFRLNYDTPETIGSDRLALAAGATRLTGENLMVIDAGTCITYDIVTSQGVYEGGAISPGINMRYRAMHDYTAALPFPEQIPREIDFPGQNTFASLHAGALIGAASEIDGMIQRAKIRYPGLQVIITGGNGELLLKYIKNKIFAFRKNLLFLGMDILLQINSAE